MELWVMNADGTNRRPVFATPLGGANWAPYYLPDNERIIFRYTIKTNKFKYCGCWWIKTTLATWSHKIKKIRWFWPWQQVTIRLRLIGQIEYFDTWGIFRFSSPHISYMKRFCFSSNFNSTSDDFNSFDLYIVHENGTGLERVCQTLVIALCFHNLIS